MLEDLEDWRGATFRRADRIEWRHVLFVCGRAPVSVRLPDDDDWSESFKLDSWENGEPVYRSVGFLPRGSTWAGR